MSGAQLLAALAAALGAVALLDVLPARPRTPLALVALRALLRLGRTAELPPPRDLAARLDAAAVRLTPRDAMAVKTGAGMACTVAGVTTVGIAGAAVGLVGFLVPDVLLHTRARRRAARMEAELADVLDLLRVAVAAGLSPWRAIGEVGRRHPGMLAGELARAAGHVALGAPGGQALADLGRRAPAAGVRPLVAALGRAERHGAPLAPTLAAQALEARSLRAGRTAEKAAKAAPKIQLVVALALVPSALLLVAAALIGSLLP